MSKRPALRSSVTTLTKKCERLLETQEIDVAELKVTLLLLKDKATRLKALDEEVQAAFEADHSNDPKLEEVMTSEMEVSEEYRDKCTRWISMAEMKIHELEFIPSTSSSNPTAESSSTTSPAPEQAMASSFILPEFRLPKFSGEDVLKFPSFMDQFQNLVHQNPALSDVQRFCLLKNNLSGSPLSLIDGLMVTSSNYEKALALLNEAYNDPNLLMGCFVSRLHTHPAVKDPKSAQLQSLISQFEQSYHEILNLIRRLQQGSPRTQDGDENMAIVSFFLTPHLLSKIPEELQLSWYNQKSEPQTRFSFIGLLAFLKDYVKSRQACRLLSDKPVSTQGTRPNPQEYGLMKSNGTARMPHGREQRKFSATAALTSHLNKKCPKCQQDHPLWSCPSFKKLETQEKWDWIKKVKHCFNCLAHSHGVSDCKSKNSCHHCGKRHHSSLCKNQCFTPLNANADVYCPKPRPPDQPGTSTVSFNTVVSHSTQAEVGLKTKRSASSHPRVEEGEEKSLLQIVRLRISNPITGEERPIWALLDSGASLNWVQEDLAVPLGLPVDKNTQFSVTGFGAQTRTIDSQKVRFNLLSMDGSTGDVSCSAHTTDRITGALDQGRAVKVPRHLKGLDLSTTPAFRGLKVTPSLLIGAQNYYDFLTGAFIRGRPHAAQSIFGWVLSGPTSTTAFFTEIASPAPCRQKTETFVSSHVERIWDLCSLGLTEKPHEVKEVVTPILRNNRYEVNLPFLSNRRPGSNYAQALKRSNALARKLDKEKLSQLQDYFKSALQDGTIAKLENADPTEGYYMPFSGIWRQGRLRVVFDASSVDPETRLSLNDTLAVGENLLNHLFDVLLRFRQYEFPFVGDIAKAFHQLMVSPGDQKWLKFLWNNQTFSFLRVAFGLRPAPHMLNVSLRTHFQSLPDQDLAARLNKASYVDDFLASFITQEGRKTGLS